RRAGENRTIGSDPKETGIKWWLRYVVVPLIGGGGVIAIIVALIPQQLKTNDTSATPVIVAKPTQSVLPTRNEHDLAQENMLYGKWKATFKVLKTYPWDCTTTYGRD